MKLSKITKIALLIATLLPLVYMALFFASFAFAFVSSPRPNVIFDHFALFMAIHMGVMFLMFALITFYIVYLFRTDRVRNDMKALWAVAIFMGSFVAMPIFWFLHIWPENDGAHIPAAA
jgi:hypothetical protein